MPGADSAQEGGAPASHRGWPLLRLLAGYRAEYLPRDLTAGLTLAAIAIPEQMATARLGGFAPQLGLIVLVAAALAFALFGGSRFLSCGADSTITPIFFGGLTALAAARPGDYPALAAALALMVDRPKQQRSHGRTGREADALFLERVHQRRLSNREFAMRKAALVAAAALTLPLACSLPAVAQQRNNALPNAQQHLIEQAQDEGMRQAQAAGQKPLSPDQIKQVQWALDQKGFHVGRADGVLGRETRQALSEFQHQQKLQRTGSLDDQTLQALGVDLNGSTSGAATTGQAPSDQKQNSRPGTPTAATPRARSDERSRGHARHHVTAVHGRFLLVAELARRQSIRVFGQGRVAW